MGKKEEIRKIATERIHRLFELAEEEFALHPERSRRYVELALRIAKRNNAKMPGELKKKYCKKCGAFLHRGKNAELKESGGILEVKCAECGFVRKLSAQRKKTSEKKCGNKRENATPSRRKGAKGGRPR